MRAAFRFVAAAALLVGALVAAFPAAVAQAAGTADPPAGQPGTLFTFTADGYRVNEKVGTWVNTPDGAVRVIDTSIKADKDGRATWQWRAPNSAAAGTWRMVGKGEESRVENVIAVQIAIPGPTATPAGQPPAAEGAVPPSGVPGTTFAITAVGFRPGEKIDTWANTPGGSQRDVPTYLFADSRGAARWLWVSPADAEGGTWQLIGRGVDTRVERIVPVVITSGTAPSPTPSPAGDMGVSPASGIAGTTFTFTASGYTPREYLGYWATAPNGDVQPNRLNARADDSGRATWTWRAPDDAAPGVWTMTGRGQDSRVLHEARFTVTPAGAAPNLPADGVEPAAGGPGTAFRFGASGFEFEAKITYWTVDPAGKASPEAPRIRADRNGHVEFDWVAPADALGGQWEMNVYGLDSSILKKIPFRIERDAPPASPQQSVSPSGGTYGDTLTFYADSLPKGMLFGYWATDPLGAVVPSGREVRAFDGYVRFTWQIPQTVRKGTWTMTMYTSLGDRTNERPVQRVWTFEVR
jgi:hypothetical protein